MNVVRYASLAALKRNSPIILVKDVLQGIRREFGKEGKRCRLIVCTELRVCCQDLSYRFGLFEGKWVCYIYTFIKYTL